MYIVHKVQLHLDISLTWVYC